MRIFIVLQELDEKYASVILRRYAESAGNDSGIYVLRDGERIPYAALVKKVGANR